MLLSLKSVSLNLSRTALLDKANLTLDAGARLCLMGRNGAGKSTLLKVMAGEVKVALPSAIRSKTKSIDQT